MTFDATRAGQSLSELRLLQLLSPTIPTGSFNFSQGLEWAVSVDWITSENEFKAWLAEQFNGVMAHQELPLLKRLFDVSKEHDLQAVRAWSAFSLALRDTAELRVEETDRAGALVRILRALQVPNLDAVQPALVQSQLAGIAWAAVHWSVESMALLRAYAYSWLEQQVAAASS